MGGTFSKNSVIHWVTYWRKYIQHSHQEYISKKRPQYRLWPIVPNKGALTKIMERDH